MKKLIQGIVDFRKNLTDEYRSFFAKLALGQHPDALFIACSDSRVVPNVFASTDPGDLFVVRNVGNLVPPLITPQPESSVLAALEFALFALNIGDIIVCGHSECGAMKALAQGNDNVLYPQLHTWLKYGQASLQKVESGITLNRSLPRHDQISQMNVLQQMEHIASHPFVRARLDQKQVRLHGWWFDIANADVYCFEPNLNQFILIDEAEAQLILSKMM